MSFWNFLISHHAEILSRTLEHLLLVGAAMLAAVVIGIPLGIVVGRGAWALFASELGIGSSSVVSSAQILLCIPAVLLIAMIVAVGPAWFASRVQPAQVFRSE